MRNAQQEANSHWIIKIFAKAEKRFLLFIKNRIFEKQ